MRLQACRAVSDRSLAANRHGRVEAGRNQVASFNNVVVVVVVVVVGVLVAVVVVEVVVE